MKKTSFENRILKSKKLVKRVGSASRSTKAKKASIGRRNKSLFSSVMIANSISQIYNQEINDIKRFTARKEGRGKV